MKKGERSGAHPKTVEEKGKYLDFIKQLSKEEKREFSEISAWALRPLINEKNKKIKQNTILSISKSLKSKKHPITGKFMKKKLTQEDIRGVLNKIREELRREMIVGEILKTGRIKIDTNCIIVCPVCNKKLRLLHNEPTGTYSIADAEMGDITTELRVTDDVNEIFNEVKKRFGEVKDKFNNKSIRLLCILISNPKKFKEYFMADGDTQGHIFNDVYTFYFLPNIRRHEADKLFPNGRREQARPATHSLMIRYIMNNQKNRDVKK